jgi:hypothetical protein
MSPENKALIERVYPGDPDIALSWYGFDGLEVDALLQAARAEERGVSDADLERMARAHDLEVSAQRGETPLWENYNCVGSCADCEAFKRNRIAAMNQAILALFQKDKSL